jgi:hypothetical protein
MIHTTAMILTVDLTNNILYLVSMDPDSAHFYQIQHI